MKLTRRQFIVSSLLLNLATLLPRMVFGKSTILVTPTEIEGPFYPVVAQKDRDFDLTFVEGKSGSALGQVIYITGRVLDSDGSPVENTRVDLWQANAAGRYRHLRDSNKAPLDSNFQGWAIIQTGKHGTFKFKTILPGAYPAAKGWLRPPHIHFKVSNVNYQELITQMYFEDQELNNSDLLLQRKSVKEKNAMIARRSAENKNEYVYDIVIQKNNI